MAMLLLTPTQVCSMGYLCDKWHTGGTQGAGAQRKRPVKMKLHVTWKTVTCKTNASLGGNLLSHWEGKRGSQGRGQGALEGMDLCSPGAHVPAFVS